MGHTTIICEAVELLQSVKIGSHKQHTDRCVGTTLPRVHLALTPLCRRQRCLVVLPGFALPGAMSVLDWTRARTKRTNIGAPPRAQLASSVKESESIGCPHGRRNNQPCTAPAQSGPPRTCSWEQLLLRYLNAG